MSILVQPDPTLSKRSQGERGGAAWPLKWPVGPPGTAQAPPGTVQLALDRFKLWHAKGIDFVISEPRGPRTAGHPSTADSPR